MAILVELRRRVDGEHDVALGGTPQLGPVVGKTSDVDDDGVILQ